MGNSTLTWVSTNMSYYPDGGTPSAITSYYLGLFTTLPTFMGAGIEVTVGEVTNYARQPVTFGTASLYEISNTNPVIEPVSSGGTGAAVVGVGIFDALTGGNCLFYTLSSFTYNPGTSFGFAIGSLVVSLKSYTMIPGATTAWCNQNLNGWPGGSMTMPTYTNLYLAFYTDVPNVAGIGTEVTTTQVTNYSRLTVPSTVWTAYSAGLGGVENMTSLTTVISSGGTGCVVKGFGLMTAPTGGNMLWMGPCEPNWNWTLNNGAVINATHLSIGLN